jgi:hypothetical protein
MAGIAQKNGFPNCSITNDQPLDVNLRRGQNQLSEDPVV